MKTGNAFGFFVNLLLVLIGIAFIAVPIFYFNMLIESIPYFSESQTGYMKSAVENIFYKGEITPYATDIIPVLDLEAEKADLPPQVTPELVSKFIMAQALVSTGIADARFAFQWGPFIFAILFGIGLVSILLGISLAMIWRRLNMISEAKGEEKGSESRQASAGDKKIDSKRIMIVALVTLVVGVVTIFLINVFDNTNDFAAGSDGVCDVVADTICDPDCPAAGPDIDPDCINL